MTRPQQRAPKGRDRDRDDRRAVVDVLLTRAQRGVLTPAEGALLAEHVREEQRLADKSRRAMAGTTRALARHRQAADEAIVEAEQRAEAAERLLDAIRTPQPVRGDHPLYDLLDAMIGPGIDQATARGFVGDYFRVITRPEEATP
ncbi:hypothetical protein AB0I84_04740 [Streptomyces spectabilis]|uniref:hypothetical protein n=1 Tax=Streptomyces spectabilis TaxID=68270 RepID=UPI0033FD0A74